MQETTLTWKGLWSSGAAWLEARADIGGASYSDIAPVITRATMQGGPQIGNAVAASCAFSLRGVPGANVPRSAEILISMRLTDGTTASEWLPAGTFYISRRSVEPVSGMLQLECYDALLKADAVWEPSEGSWPRDMADVADELAAALGLEIDARSAIPTGGAYVMGEPDAGTTLRGALSTIAAAGGGNWIVSPAGRLRLVPFTPGADAVAVEAVLSDARASDAQAVTGVRCLQDGGDPLLVGDDTGIVLDVGLTPVLAAEMSATVIGAAYQGCSLSGAVYDPAAELGDRLTYGAGVSSVLACETVTLGPAPRGEVSAPELSELADEYPFLGGSARALTLAKAYAREAVEALDGDLTQAEIFNRLTGNGAAQGLVLYNGQLYINASFINTGILNADLIQTGMLTSENGRLTLNTETGVIRSYSDPSDLPAPTMAEIVNSGITFYTHDPTGEFTYVIGRLLSGFNSNNVPNLYLEVDPNGYRGGILNINNGIAYLTLQGDTVYVSRLQSSRIGGTWIGSAIGVEYGGTGANNAADARTNLGAQQDMGFYIDDQGYICQRIGSDA